MDWIADDVASECGIEGVSHVKNGLLANFDRNNALGVTAKKSNLIVTFIKRISQLPSTEAFSLTNYNRLPRDLERDE